jgi:hypothetical protein
MTEGRDDQPGPFSPPHGTPEPGWGQQPTPVPPAEGLPGGFPYEPPTEAAPKRRRTGRRRALLAAGLLLLLGVFATGFGLGWTSGRAVSPDALPDTKAQVVAAPAKGDSKPVTLPDVRGLQLVDAQQAMADAGLPTTGVTVKDAPAALPAGTILRQDPIGGTVGAAGVTLFVAVPGTVPPVVGTQATDALQNLEDLGASVRQVARYAPGTPEGTVLDVTPPAGAPLATEVVLTVSGPADSVFLSDVKQASGSCGTGSASVNGVKHDNSVTCSPGSGETTAAWLLDRQVTQLTGVLGVEDRSDPGTTIAVRIAVDGRVVFDQVVGYGTATPFTVDVTGVLRLEVTYSSPSTSGQRQLALGDARLVGDPAGVAALDQK